jgi:hypothetical protein
MVEIKPFAFVLMPFDKSFDDIYQYGIKQACTELAIVAERVDEQFYSETMLERIYRQIENADLIIADMTGKNPNVFYEVGYAHAKGKMCALITQKADDIPFDLQNHFHIIYDGKIGNLKSQLLPRLKWMREELENAKRETIQMTISTGYPELEVSDFIHKGAFDLKFILKNVAKTRSPEIDAISITTTDKWRVYQGEHECPSEQPEKGLKKSFITPKNSRLSPNALSQIDLVMKRTFWTKWSGDEKKNSYRSRGNLQVEVATAEGILPFAFDLDLQFDESPF